MDTERIVEGVIDSIDELGPVPPSARRLANRLHVAPATLYSSVPSLFDAYGQARAVLAESFVGPLVTALAQGDAGKLVRLLTVSPNRSTFVTDPSWDLPDCEALQAARADTDVTHDMVIDALALVGSFFSVDTLAANPPTQAQIEEVLAVYQAALEAKPAASAPSSAVSEVARSAIDSITKQQLDSVSESIQVKSVELIVANTKWSFRALREQTGLAVSRLHRYGSRIDHMANAYITLGSAAAQWANNAVDHDKAPSVGLAVLLQTGAPEVMAELQLLRRCDPDGRAKPDQQEQVDAIVGPRAVAITTAQARRGVDPALIAGMAAALCRSNSLPIAA